MLSCGRKRAGIALPLGTQLYTGAGSLPQGATAPCRAIVICKLLPELSDEGPARWDKTIARDSILLSMSKCLCPFCPFLPWDCCCSQVGCDMLLHRPGGRAVGPWLSLLLASVFLPFLVLNQHWKSKYHFTDYSGSDLSSANWRRWHVAKYSGIYSPAFHWMWSYHFPGLLSQTCKYRCSSFRITIGVSERCYLH